MLVGLMSARVGERCTLTAAIDALDRSVATLLRTQQEIEGTRPADIEGPSYEEWKRERGNAQTSTVADFLGSLKNLKGPVRYDPPQPNGPRSS
ncbi:MAG TPA: hypothetical protein VF783_02380 [Terriglobales bacterium]